MLMCSTNERATDYRWSNSGHICIHPRESYESNGHRHDAAGLAVTLLRDGWQGGLVSSFWAGLTGWSADCGRGPRR
jgi:hypothetical protein